MSLTAEADTVAERLCAAYEGIDTIQCEIRKTSIAEAHTVRMLSRVAYQKPNRLHVVNAAPMERRIVMDGMNLYYYQAGCPKGFSRPVADLIGPWAVAARDIPATPMEHLVRVRSLPETILMPDENGWQRTAYRGTNVYAVLTTDAQGRLHRLDVYPSEDAEAPIGEYRYENFVAAGDAWIPLLHRGMAHLPDGGEVTETRIIDNLRVNEPITPDTFDPSRFFTNVTFTAEFMDTFEK